MTVSVLIPMYNERAIAYETARTLAAAMTAWETETGNGWEILFADDGSTDGCGDLLREMLAREGLAGRIRVVGYPVNRGKGCAVRTAALASVGDVMLYTDCDLAYGTDIIGRAVSLFTPGTDLVIGSRRREKDGYSDYTALRKIASVVYVGVLRVLTGFRLSDSQCGCKAMRGDVGRRIFALCETDGFAFDQELLMIADRMHLTVQEMPVRIINHRESKVHVFRDTFRMVRDLLKIRRRVRKIPAETLSPGR